VVFLFYFAGMNLICINGKIVSADEPALMASNRSYRYGDGLFETMKVRKGELLLGQLHFERLFEGLLLLKFDLPVLFSAEKLEEEIIKLCRKNNCEDLARVRLSVYRGCGGLYDEDKTPGYVIECWPLNESVNEMNGNGLVIDVFPHAEKSCDKYSNLKSANFLPYAMAALYAKENKLNDSLVLNTSGRIADSTIANIFLIKSDNILTPALSEGCINGVMRKYLLTKMPEDGYKVSEGEITIRDIETADEVFLTNAIKGIQWVGRFRDKTYSKQTTTEVYTKVMKFFIS
jgi:branched-chain amino acid aminotransferase